MRRLACGSLPLRAFTPKSVGGARELPTTAAFCVLTPGPLPWNGPCVLRGLKAFGVLTCCLTLLAAAPSAVVAAKKHPKAGTSVVGGGLVPFGALPYTVAIDFNGALCTGSLISSTAVLTAAHCLDGASPDTTSVRINSVHAFIGGQVLGVTSGVYHPEYSSSPATGSVNDIAVINLASPATAPAVPLASQAESAALTGLGAQLTVAGFGRANPLRKTRKPMFGPLRAARVFVRRGCAWYTGFDAGKMICASGSAYAKATVTLRSGRKKSKGVQRDSCQGDSGGPLIADTPSGPRVVGVVSYGPSYPRIFSWLRCGLKGFPGAYTRVSSHLGFIQANM